MKLSDVLPDDLSRAGLVVLTTLASAPAFAEEPAVANHGARTVVFQADAGLSVGSETLDSGTAEVREEGPFYGGLSLSGGVRPLPFPLVDSIYLGPTLDFRFSPNGAGLAHLGGEVGVEGQTLSVRVRIAEAWNPLDGNAFTNIDGIPDVALSVGGTPMPKKLPAVSVFGTLGTNLPQGFSLHPAFAYGELGVRGTWEVSTKPIAKREGAESAVATAVTTDSVKPEASLREQFPSEFTQESLVREIAKFKSDADVLTKAYFQTSPKIGSSNYNSQTEDPKFIFRYSRPVVKEETGEHLFASLEESEYSQLGAKEFDKLPLTSFIYQIKGVTLDELPVSVDFALALSLDETKALVQEIDAIVLEAKSKGITVSPRVLTEYLMAQRFSKELPQLLEEQQKLDKLRVASFMREKQRSAKIQEQVELYNEDRDACAKNKVCLGNNSLVQVGEELAKRAQDSAWPAAFTNYERILTLEEMGVLAGYSDHFRGAQAARALGRVEDALEAVDQALLYKYSPEAVAFKESILSRVKWVNLNSTETLMAIPPSFNPDDRAALAFAQAQLTQTGHFEGYLFFDADTSYTLDGKPVVPASKAPARKK